MNISDSSNPDLFRAYPDSTVDLWNKNIVNGKYIVAYTMSSNLDDKLKNMLPMVRCFIRNSYNRLVKFRP